MCINVCQAADNNALQPSPLRGSGCNALLPLDLANVNARKRMFDPSIIVSFRGAGAFGRVTTNLTLQVGDFSRALKTEKSKVPLFPGPGCAG